MKLAAIYNVWDGEEHLQESISAIREHVDVVICVVQTTSNHGNRYDGGYLKCKELKQNWYIDDIIVGEPVSGIIPSSHETMKRNIGLHEARNQGCTHFISMDCDEIYDTYEFRYCKSEIIQYKCASTVVDLITYFGTKEYVITPKEEYYVPFICKLNKNTKVGSFDNGYYCDPTRKPNNGQATFNNPTMHHYSWIRDDIGRKIDNSSANVNLKKYRAELINACANPLEGMKVPFYPGKHLRKI